MSTRGFATVVLTLAASLPGLARAGMADSMYFGIRGGAAHTNIDSDNLTQELRSRGHAVTAKVDDNDTAGEIYVGRMIGPHAGIELSFRSLGQFPVTVSGTTTKPLSQLADDVVDAGPKGGSAVALAVHLQLPVLGSEHVFFAPRVGFMGWRQRGDVATPSGVQSAERNGFGEFVGMGLDFRFGPHFGIGAGGELLRPDSEGTNQQLYGQVEYRW